MRLETGRLVLTPHAAADFGDMAQLWADPQVVEPIGLPVSTQSDCWSRLLRYAGLWSLLGYGYWAIRTRRDGRFVGEAGFGQFHRAMTPPISVPEAGWALARWAHGHGYAREAMTAALAWFDARAHTTVCLIGPANAPSLRLAERLGYRQPIPIRCGDRDTLLLTRTVTPAAGPAPAQ
jgi:RimJ/RimL family protein N-acetyltransferase